MSEITTFECTLVKKIYSSSNFKILSVKPTKKDSKLKYNKFKNITITGDLPDFEKDVLYTVDGVYKYNLKFGGQYEVIKVYRDKPRTQEEYHKFLREILTERQANILLEAYPNIVEMVINNEEVDLSLTKV